jgi:DinB family protein
VTDLDTLRYPVGRFERLTQPLDRATRDLHIATLEGAPARFRALVAPLSDAQLDTPYRPGGWTIRQVIHHVPDSHMNAYIRTKLAVTEDNPRITTYEEQLWAEFPEAKHGPVDVSLTLLSALHRRWVTFLRALSDGDFRKTFQHKEWGSVAVEEAVAMYAWHTRHHAAHIEQALTLTVQSR